MQLLDLADDEIALQAAQAVDEENAVEMIDLVLHGAGQQLFAFDLNGISVYVLRANLDPCGAADLLANLGQAQAAFFLDLLALALDDLRD